tara:strand:- start:43850 stop:45031 length:1182 start_codon:yes stop_codon:yes gene_type:complete
MINKEKNRPLAIAEQSLPRADDLLAQYPMSDHLINNLRPGLAELLKDLASRKDINSNGVQRNLHNIHDDLARLKAIYDDRVRYPEIANVEIKQPLFILGLPRCGTSLLHALMESDPSVRAPLQWEVAYPSPPPETVKSKTDPRIAQYDAYLRAQFGGDYTELMKGHPLGPMIPQECGSFMTTSFQSTNPSMMTHLPDYYRWVCNTDVSFRYEVHKMWLQQLSWRNPGKHWVLKIQEHMYKMRELRAVYPDALFIQPHRDPATVIASISQLIRVIRTPAYDQIDSHALGKELLYLWWDGVKCMIDYRKANPSLPIYDMRFNDLVSAPVKTIRAAYEYFNWEFTDASAKGIVEWLNENPVDKHGARSYSLEEFGLDETLIHNVFAEYCEIYGKYF